MIRALLVDDEAPARARLRQLLKAEEDFVIVGECANGRQAIEAVTKERPDLLFLDVQMPRLSGLDICNTLASSGAPMPLVIFVTAYDQYALKAFEVHAIDYLLKPFDRERFQKALEHARKQLRRTQGTTDARLEALLTDWRARNQRADRLVFKQNGRVVFVRVETIDWIEADGNYVKLRAGPDSHHFRETLATLEEQLPADKFLRVSRSTIVNLDRIKELQPLFYGDYAVILHDGTRLGMSRNYRDRLELILERRK